MDHAAAAKRARAVRACGGEIGRGVTAVEEEGEVEMGEAYNPLYARFADVEAEEGETDMDDEMEEGEEEMEEGGPPKIVEIVEED